MSWPGLGRTLVFTSDVVLETEVLVSRRLEDKKCLDLGLETQSLGLGLEVKVLVLT